MSEISRDNISEIKTANIGTFTETAEKVPILFLQMQLKQRVISGFTVRWLKRYFFFQAILTVL